MSVMIAPVRNTRFVKRMQSRKQYFDIRCTYHVSCLVQKLKIGETINCGEQKKDYKTPVPKLATQGAQNIDKQQL